MRHRAYTADLMLVRSVVTASLLAAFASVALPACAAAHEEDVEVSEDALGAGPPTALVPASSGASTRVRAGGMTVWFEGLARVAYVGAELRATLRLRTSRSLESAMSYVPDDGFGDARLVSPQVVEIDLRGGHEINTVLSGLPLFVHLRTKSGAVREYDARLDVAPRFARFTGSSTLFVHEAIKPVWSRVGAPEDPLRYRARASQPGATSLSAFTDDDSDPVVKSLGGGEFQLDWRYPELQLTFDYPNDPVYFAASVGGAEKTKQAGIDLRVTQVGLTREGATTAWPTPSCAPAVRTCITAAGGMATAELGHCGTYREVSRCIDALACSPSLAPRAAGALPAARTAFNAACPSGLSWCSVTDLHAFDVGGCEGPVTLEDVAQAAARDLPDPHGWGEGTTLTRAELATRSTFGANGGPALLAAIDAYVGTTNVVAKEYVAEVPCHNCTERALRYVLFYPDTQVVVVVDAKSGWDS